MIFSDYWMLWSILAPLAGAFLLQLLDYFAPGRMEGWIRIFVAATSMTALAAALSGWNTVRVLHMGGWAAELGIVLVTDRLSSVFLLLSSLGGAASAGTAFFPFRKEHRRFCGLFFILWGSLNGILVTGDLFNMYVFFEILAVSAYVLAGAALTREALEAGLKYLVLGTVGALFLLLGTSLLYMGSGTLNLALLSAGMETMPRGAAAAAAACLVTGLGLKMGMFPFHFWLPDAHSSASTGVSMILSGVVVKASFYSLLRIVFLLFPRAAGRLPVSDILLWLGVLSLAGGHLSAQRQRDVKRLLAWSTVAHMGYLLIGAGCASPLGIGGAVLHALNHGTAKMGLFLGAGSLAAVSGNRDWRSFGGTSARYPAETGAFALMAASIAGIPPLAGFWSKWMIILAAAERGAWAAALAAASATVLSCLYYVPLFFVLYGPEKHGDPEAVAGEEFAGRKLLFTLAASAVLFAFLYLVPALREQFLMAGSAALAPDVYIWSVLGGTVP